MKDLSVAATVLLCLSCAHPTTPPIASSSQGQVTSPVPQVDPLAARKARVEALEKSLGASARHTPLHVRHDVADGTLTLAWSEDPVEIKPDDVTVSDADHIRFRAWVISDDETLEWSEIATGTRIENPEAEIPEVYHVNRGASLGIEGDPRSSIALVKSGEDVVGLLRVHHGKLVTFPERNAEHVLAPCEHATLRSTVCGLALMCGGRVEAVLDEEKGLAESNACIEKISTVLALTEVPRAKIEDALKPFTLEDEVLDARYGSVEESLMTARPRCRQVSASVMRSVENKVRGALREHMVQAISTASAAEQEAMLRAYDGHMLDGVLPSCIDAQGAFLVLATHMVNTDATDWRDFSMWHVKGDTLTFLANLNPYGGDRTHGWRLIDLTNDRVPDVLLPDGSFFTTQVARPIQTRESRLWFNRQGTPAVEIDRKLNVWDSRALQFTLAGSTFAPVQAALDRETAFTQSFNGLVVDAWSEVADWNNAADPCAHEGRIQWSLRMRTGLMSTGVTAADATKAIQEFAGLEHCAADSAWARASAAP